MASRSTHPRTVALAAAALTVALGAAACSGSASGDSAQDKGFTYWSMWKQGEPQQKVIASAITDFEKKTGITVDVQWQGRNNLQKLVPALNTDNVPDLVDGSYVNGYPVLPAPKQAHGLKAAYAAKTADGKTVNSLIPAKFTKSIDLNLPDGQPWMLPYTISSDAIWFNGAKYPQLKTDPPKTWNEFISLLKGLKAKGVAPIAADGDIAGYNAYWLTTLLDRSGGPGTFMKIASDKTGQAWKRPEALAAAKKVEQLVKGGYLIKGYGASKFPFNQQKWATNKAALILMGSWLPTEAASYASPGLKFDSFQFPTTGSHDAARVDFTGFMVPKKAKNATAAEKFAAFFMSKKYQDALGTDAKVLPVRADASVTPELASVQEAINSAKSYRQQNDGVAFPGYNDKVFNPTDDQLFLGKISAQQFVDTMAKEQAEYWKNQS